MPQKRRWVGNALIRFPLALPQPDSFRIIEEAMAELLIKAIDRDPDRRFRTAADLRDALKALPKQKRLTASANYFRSKLWMKVILMSRLQAAGMTGRLPYLVSTVMPQSTRQDS